MSVYFNANPSFMSYIVDLEVEIPVGNIFLTGDLIVPENAKGLVIFSHGSGSSRKSIRNRAVASFLHLHGLGTLLFDLLTSGEDIHFFNRFNISLLTDRLIKVTHWLEHLDLAQNLPLGYFGASTGAASALSAASRLRQVSAVVSRGGRPDLAFEDLPFVKAPTLLIVGGLDHEVLNLNQDSIYMLGGPKKLEVIEGAGHLFEEEGKMDMVAELAAQWFSFHLLNPNAKRKLKVA